MVKNASVAKASNNSAPNQKVYPTLLSLNENPLPINGNVTYNGANGYNIELDGLRAAILNAKSVVNKIKVWGEINYADEGKPSGKYEIYLYEPTAGTVTEKLFPFEVKINDANDGVDHLFVLTNKKKSEKIKYHTQPAKPYEPTEAPDKTGVYGPLTITFVK